MPDNSSLNTKKNSDEQLSPELKNRLRPMISSWIMGFYCAVPLAFLMNLLKLWLNDAQISLELIGLISITFIPYNLKLCWAPFLDRYTLPFLGRRRGWIFCSQIFLILLTASFYFIDPKNFNIVFLFSLLIAFFSATQDTVVDAYRREDLDDHELAQGSAYYLWGYRFALIIVGGGGIILADFIPWKYIFLIISVLLAFAPIILIFSPEPTANSSNPKTLMKAYAEPFFDFFKRKGIFYFLLFVFLYKIGDQLAAELLSVFYNNIGYSKSSIGLISKIFGGVATALGALLGWRFIKKWKLWISLMVFAVFQGFSTLIFVLLAILTPNNIYLAMAVSVENLAAGAGTAAFMTLLASLTNKRYTAFQYALLSSLMTLGKNIFGSFTGFLVQIMGWPLFFTFCAFLALPGIILLANIKPQISSLDA